MGCYNYIFILLVIVICSVHNVDNAEHSKSQTSTLKPNSYEGPKKLYSKQIGYNGDSLIIGSAYELEITENQMKDYSSTSLHKCIISNALEYEEFLETKLMIRPSKSYIMHPSESQKMVPVEFSKYFLHITKEVWLCRDPTDKLPEFYRVVNELISYKDIFEIKYYPDIDVSSVDYLGGNKRSAKIKETKLLIKKGTKLVRLKFDSELTLVNDHAKQHPIPNFHAYHYTMEPISPRKGPDMKKDVVFKTKRETEFRPITISSTGTGKALKIGSTWDKLYEGETAKETSDTVCRREQGADIPHLFTPECFQRFDIAGSKTKIYAKITEQDFQEMFTVASREVWLCTGPSTQIYRVVNLVIGRIPVKEIEFEDGITSVHSINIHNGISVRFREVSYFDVYTLKRFQFEVVRRLEEYTVTESKLKNSMNIIRDIKYELLPMAIYKNLINAEGYDLRIGSKPTKTLIASKGDAPVMCKEANNFQRAFHTRLRLKIVVDNVLHTMKLFEDNEESKQFFKYKSKRVWTCEREKLRFLRIAIVIQVLVPVREIETFDGVELVEKPVSNGKKKLLEIYETKYLQEDEPVMYLGELEFENAAVIDESSQKCGPNTVRKSLDETSPRMGPMATKYCYRHLRDLNFLVSQPRTELSRLTVGAGDHFMRFKVEPYRDYVNTDWLGDVELQNVKGKEAQIRYRTNNKGQFSPESMEQAMNAAVLVEPSPIS